MIYTIPSLWIFLLFSYIDEQSSIAVLQFQFSRKLSQLDLLFLTVVVRARIGYSGGIFWEDSLMRTEGPHDKRKTPKLKIGKYSISFFFYAVELYTSKL